MTAVGSYDLFVSYADADRAWVEGYLIDALEAAGVRCHSEAAFALGVPRVLEFERAVQQSQRTLIILSQAYLADNFSQFADLLVQTYGLESGTWPVIPLILEPVTLPLRLSLLTPLDVTDSAGRSEAIERLCAALQRPLPPDPPKPPCPFPGMVQFGEADSARFFGREQEVQDLLERLRFASLLTVIGPSGSGKSSLVFAGLLPALRKSGLFGVGTWLVQSMRPGSAPNQALASLLHGDLDQLGPAVAALLEQAGAARLLLIVDQFEETFTVAGPEATAFQQALLRLREIPNVCVLLTVRADFYPELMTSPLWSIVQMQRMEVAPLDANGLRRAIVRSAEQVGVYVEAALVERLVADAAGEPGVLPLLQETLVLLWERLERRCLPLRAYEALVWPQSAGGSASRPDRLGLQVAIARRADAALAGLSPAQQMIARRIFIRLIQFGEGRADTRRQQPLAALRSFDDDPAAFQQTIACLTASRLLTLSGAERRGRTNGAIAVSAPSLVVAPAHAAVLVDIAHEALIAGWPTLRAWLAERREAEQTRRRIEDKAAEWVRLGQAHGGLLDIDELPEAERWLSNPDAADLGYAATLPQFVEASRAAITSVEREKEAARQRELAQAKALLAAERRARRWLQGVVGLLGALVLATAGFLVWPYVLSLMARGEMLAIPAGAVTMGTNGEDAYPEEQPEWQATLPAFWIERYEVSNRQYGLCIAARVCSVPDDPIQYANPQLQNHPVVGITAIQAAEYCRWLGRRLPTELEWERAARGPSPGRPWPWGDAQLTAERANVWIDAQPTGTEPVNSHPLGKSLEGVYNLVGNVWEWTSSFRQDYAHYDQQQFWDGTSLAALAQHNLIYRGGGWEDTIERVTRRFDQPGNMSAPSLGIRCASDS